MLALLVRGARSVWSASIAVESARHTTSQWVRIHSHPSTEPNQLRPSRHRRCGVQRHAQHRGRSSRHRLANSRRCSRRRPPCRSG